MRIALVSDTYAPEVNGVTTVLQRIVGALRGAGHDVVVVAPVSGGGRQAGQLRVSSVPFPPYPAIRLSLPRFRRVDAFLAHFNPDVVHVATEGPLGFLGRRLALAAGVPLVTSFHTQFARYSRDYGVPALEPLIWRWLVWFHRPARLTHTPGEAIRHELLRKGLDHVTVWGRGVNTKVFQPGLRHQRLRSSLGAGNGTALILQGVPVIAADAGGLPESVRHFANGLLVRPTDAAGFAAAIIELTMESGLRRELGLAARCTAETRDVTAEDALLLRSYERVAEQALLEPVWSTA